MAPENLTEISIPLDQELQDLSRLAQQIDESLKQTPGHPAELSQALAQLSSRLSTVSARAARREEERHKLAALADIGRIVNSSLELSEVLRIVMDTIVRLTGAERGFLMLKGEDGELQISMARNWERETIDESELTISRTVINRVVEQGHSVLTTNAQEDPRFGGKHSIVAYSLRSILCVPLKNKEQELTGVIYCDNRIRAGIFSEAEQELLSAFANQASVAIENARLFESVRRTLAEVTELKNLMDNVLASIVSGVITADLDEKITLCNRAAESILGRRLPEIVGRPLGEVLPELADELTRQISMVRQIDRPVVGLEYERVLPQRGPVVLRLNLSPLKDASESAQGVAIVLDDLTENRRLEAMHRLFERMVSPAVIEELDPNQLQLGGRRAEITTWFADLRGYTEFSESMSPERLVTILNRYLGAATDAVLNEGGTLNKFLGDAVMAFFNAPVRQPDHTLRAVRAALRLKKAVEELHAELPVHLQLSFGVGIHYGEAVLGLVGSEKRLEYTAIGDSVNTAKRIQENSGPNQILVSAAAAVQLQDAASLEPVQPIAAKGKSKPVTVYEVRGLN